MTVIVREPQQHLVHAAMNFADHPTSIPRSPFAQMLTIGSPYYFSVFSCLPEGSEVSQFQRAYLSKVQFHYLFIRLMNLFSVWIENLQQLRGKAFRCHFRLCGDRHSGDKRVPPVLCVSSKSCSSTHAMFLHQTASTFFFSV